MRLQEFGDFTVDDRVMMVMRIDSWGEKIRTKFKREVCGT